MNKTMERLMGIVETQMELLEDAQETVKQCANRGEEMFDEIIELTRATAELLRVAYAFGILSRDNDIMNIYHVGETPQNEKGDAEA